MSAVEVFPKAKGTRVVRARSLLCEVCGVRLGREFSHRIAASRGGTWAPSNGCRACRRCHGWLEIRPNYAGDGGWHIRRTLLSPPGIPVFIVTALTPLGAWHLLLDDGSREEVYPDDFGLPEVPAHLPPGHVRTSLGRPLATTPWMDPR